MASKKSRRLSFKSGPSGLGLTFYAVVYLLLDKFQPAGWVWGVVGTICGLILIVNVVDMWIQERYVINEKGELVRE